MTFFCAETSKKVTMMCKFLKNRMRDIGSQDLVGWWLGEGERGGEGLCRSGGVSGMSK